MGQSPLEELGQKNVLKLSLGIFDKETFQVRLMNKL